MKKLHLLFLCSLVTLYHGWSDTTTPDFKEVYDLLRTNLGGVDEKTLNHAAVQGLLSQLDGRVVLVRNETDAAGSTNGPSVTSSVYDKSYGYLRLNRLGEDADRQFRSEYAKLNTNKLKGLILDLRYTSGQNYAGAVAIADMFLPNEQPLLDWGDGMRQSTSKSNPINVPVALLANRKTSGLDCLMSPRPPARRASLKNSSSATASISASERLL